MVTNLLGCYFIVEVFYAKSLLIIKLIFMIIEFDILREANYISDGLAKPQRKTKPP